ncbi:hypothetical protein TYRP_000280 [Tyrophagus putrescentiae]|nr:hypothetical protein TYRP_000280 [Tyrophagus putrescentiae]
MKVQLLFVTVCVLVALHVCYSNAAVTSKPAAPASTTAKPTTTKPTTAAPTKAPTTGKPTTGKETTKHMPTVTGSTGKHNGTTVKPPHTTTHKHSGSYQVTISLGTMFLLLCAVFAFNH